MKRIILVLLITLINNLSAQDKYLNKNVLILRITYFNYIFPEHLGDEYCLVDFDSLETVINRLEKDTTVYSERMLYNLTKAGAVFISSNFIDWFTKDCCVYGDIGKVYSDSGLNLGNYGMSSNFDSLSVVARDSVQIKNKIFFYKVKYWSAEINYCLCNLYMELPSQSIYNYKGAYIYGKSENKHPSRKQRKLVNRMIEKLGYK